MMKQANPNDHTQPDWPTTVRGRLPGGRVLGTDGSMWLYRTVPLDAVEDALTPEKSLEPGEPLLSAFEELAAMATTRIARRATSKGTYREAHLLLINVPGSYHLPPDQQLATYLNAEFAHQEVKQRLLLFGVRLIPTTGFRRNGLRAAIASVTETLVSKSTPVSDFDEDYERVDAALARSGLTVPTVAGFALANSWWSSRRTPATAFVPHPGHIHVFDTIESAQVAERSGSRDCADWLDVENQHAITFAAVQEFDLPFAPATAPRSRWAESIRNNGALAVSIRGLVEPARVTRAELRRRRQQYTEDIEERYRSGKMERAEQEKLLSELTAVEAAYANTDSAPPTLTDAMVTVALDGIRPNLYESSWSNAFRLAEMAYRQPAAMAEAWMASPVRANPNLHDIPCHTIAYSGLPGMSVVGDATGAQVGLTLTDRQPAFLSNIAASRGDSLPAGLIVGQTGSGKTQLLLYLAHQFALAGVPQVVFDPKLESDHSDAVRLSGGRVASLDSLLSADGVLDPMRFSDTPEKGIEAASAMLMAVNPWGSKAGDYYTPVMKALKIGVADGATCIGQAVKIALGKGEPKEVLNPILDLADASPTFRACVGMNTDAPRLRVADGITLIKVGSNALNLPESGLARKDMTPPQRAAVNLIRMVTIGSMRALAGRDGVLHLDEAWTVLGSGRSEVDEIGRTARSQRVLPLLYTQKVSDALDAGLAGYISRVLILPITDVDEAKAACTLAELQVTPDRIAAITANSRRGSAPNWDSMRALVDPVTKKVLRGSVAIYRDLSGRAVPVEVKIPPEFLYWASTNPDDIERRRAGRDHVEYDADLLY